MFSRLLVGMDRSEGGEAALRAALALGRRFRSSIVLAAVAEPETDPLQHQAPLAAAAERVRAEGLDCEVALTRGAVEEELLRLLERAEALVVGRRGEAHDRADALGGVTRKLVRRAPKPVLVAGAFPSRYERLVVAYEGGETSAAALAIAARYAEAAGVALDVVHVSDDAGAAGELLARAGAFLSAQPVPFVTHHLRGKPVAAIAGHVALTAADLLVVGAHEGRRRSWSVGSTAEGLLLATPVPLLINR